MTHMHLNLKLPNLRFRSTSEIGQLCLHIFRLSKTQLAILLVLCNIIFVAMWCDWYLWMEMFISSISWLNSQFQDNYYLPKILEIKFTNQLFNILRSTFHYIQIKTQSLLYCNKGKSEKRQLKWINVWYKEDTNRINNYMIGNSATSAISLFFSGSYILILW